MENILSTFIRSIFVDNMVFAYYLGKSEFSLIYSLYCRNCFICSIS